MYVWTFFPLNGLNDQFAMDYTWTLSKSNGLKKELSTNRWTCSGLKESSGNGCTCSGFKNESSSNRWTCNGLKKE
jgi:frataxin-like iron-binding protein CyaY